MRFFKMGLYMGIFMLPVIFLPMVLLTVDALGWSLIFIIVVVAILSYWDEVLLGLYGAKKITIVDYPNIIKIVQMLSLRLDIGIPNLYISYKNKEALFPIGNIKTNKILIGENLLKELDGDELELIFAHAIEGIKLKNNKLTKINAKLSYIFFLLYQHLKNIILLKPLQIFRIKEIEKNIEFVFFCILVPLYEFLDYLTQNKNELIKIENVVIDEFEKPQIFLMSLYKISNVKKNNTSADSFLGALCFYNYYEGERIWSNCNLETSMVDRILKRERLKNC